MSKKVLFDSHYYSAIMKEFGYSPLEFEPISFSLGKLTNDDLRRQWLCHMNGNSFAIAVQNGKRAIVTTGFGLSGIPHVGTLSQIIRALRLQQAGLPVQIVLGDLDAYNGKNANLDCAQQLVSQYRAFIRNLGFNDSPPNSLRAQYESLTTLRTAYLIGHYMDDEMFSRAEEDLHEFYSDQGKVDSTMSYRRKLSLNLMIADFLELLMYGGFDAILITLGIDEHQYVNFGRETMQRVQADSTFPLSGRSYSAMYSGIIRGFHGYPKMSKSFPESGISVDMGAEDITRLIMNGEVVTEFPETNVVYQMISSVSLYDSERINEAYEECRKQSRSWSHIKSEYATHLHQLCQRWHEQ